MQALRINRLNRIAGSLLEVLDALASGGDGGRFGPVLGRVEHAAEEVHGVEEARDDRGADMVRAANQPVFVGDTGVEEDAVHELSALFEEEHVLVAGFEIDAEADEAIG